MIVAGEGDDEDAKDMTGGGDSFSFLMVKQLIILAAVVVGVFGVVGVVDAVEVSLVVDKIGDVELVDLAPVLLLVGAVFKLII